MSNKLRIESPGTSTEVEQQRIIHDNIVLWRRQRRRRTDAIVAKDQQSRAKKFENKGLATLAEAFIGKRVGV